MAENYSSKLDELKKKISSLEKLAKKQSVEQNKKHQVHAKKVKGDMDKHRKEIKKHKEDIDRYKKQITSLNTKLKKLEQKKMRAQLKPTTTFKGQMGRLSKNVEDLLGLLEQAGKEVGDGKLQADKDIVDKLDTILNQNEKIAQGILAVADLIRAGKQNDNPADAFAVESEPQEPPVFNSEQYPGVAPYQQAAETPANYVDKHDFGDLSSDLLGEDNQEAKVMPAASAQYNAGQDDLFGDIAQSSQGWDTPRPTMDSQQKPQQPFRRQAQQPFQQQAQQPFQQQAQQPFQQQAQQPFQQQAQQPFQQQAQEPFQRQQPRPMHPPPMNFNSQFGIDQTPQPPPPMFDQEDIFNSPVQRRPDSNYMQAREDQINPLQPVSLSNDSPLGVMPFDAPPPPPDSDLMSLGPPPSPNDFQPIQQNTAPAPPGRTQLRPFDNG